MSPIEGAEQSCKLATDKEDYFWFMASISVSAIHFTYWIDLEANKFCNSIDYSFDIMALPGIEP